MTAIRDIPNIRLLGRTLSTEGAHPMFYSSSGCEFLFAGADVYAELYADYSVYEPWVAIFINDALVSRLPLQKGENKIQLLRGFEDGKPKKITLLKDTQAMFEDPDHIVLLKGLEATEGEFLPLEEPSLRLSFIGDSITTGEGCVGALKEEAWNATLMSSAMSYPRVLSSMLNAEYQVLSQSGWGVLSGWDNDPRHKLPVLYEGLCTPYKGKLAAKLHSQEPYDFSFKSDWIIINLSTNDDSAINQTPFLLKGKEYKQTLEDKGEKLIEGMKAFLLTVRKHNPSSKILWCYGMLPGGMFPYIEEAVRRCEDEKIFTLELEAVREDSMGSRQHPGALCHVEAAADLALFLSQH